LIVHKTFTQLALSWRSDHTLAKQEKVREEAEKFIAKELDQGDVINITETLLGVGRWMQIGGLFSVTIWYRKP